MAQKDDLGLQFCYNGDDYFAGAAAACGGVEKIPTRLQSQLIELVNYLYNTDLVDIVKDGIPNVPSYNINGLTLDYDKVSALGFNFSSSYGHFWLMLGPEFGGHEVFFIGFFPSYVQWGYSTNGSGRGMKDYFQVMCLEGDDSPTLCEQVEENFNIKSSACDTEIDTIVTAASSGSFASATPHIVFANGLKMYIASELDEIADLADSDDDDDTTGYLIYMDVNGDSGKSVLYQDVFPFYLLKSGKVVPLYNADKDAGAATSAHLSVNAYYDTYSNGTRTVNLLLAGSDFMTAACSVGYVTSETYCGSITKSSYCSDKTADCRYKVYKPIKIF